MISIIIPTKNRFDLLKQCVESLKPHLTGDMELVIVESGNDLQSADYAQELGCKFEMKTGASFAEACNLGFSQHQFASDILLVNNDIIFDHSIDWSVLYRGTPTPNCLGTKLLYPNHLVQHAGIGFDVAYNPYNLWEFASANHPQVNIWRRRFAVSFAFAFIDWATWRNLGGLDEHYINAYEDVDFCLRILELGGKVVYRPELCATHLVAQTAGRHDKVQESWQYFRKKWIETGRISEVLGVWPFQQR